MLSLQILSCAEFFLLQTFKPHPYHYFTVATFFSKSHYIFFSSFLSVIPPFTSVIP